MGLCTSRLNESADLRATFQRSILAKLISEDDYHEFLAFTELESITPYSLLNLGKSKLIMVVEGTIVASVSKSSKSKSFRLKKRKQIEKRQSLNHLTVPTKTYGKGDVLLLPVTELMAMSPLLLESLYGTATMKMCFQAQHLGSNTTVLKIDLDSLTKFVLTRRVVCPMFNLLRVKLSDVLCSSVLFKGMTSSQFNVLSPLLTLRCVSQGELLTADASLQNKLRERTKTHHSVKRVRILLGDNTHNAEDSDASSCSDLSDDSSTTDGQDESPSMCIVLTGTCARISTSKFVRELNSEGDEGVSRKGGGGSTKAAPPRRGSVLGASFQNNFQDLVTGIRKRLRIEPVNTLEENRIDDIDRSVSMTDSSLASEPVVYCGQEFCLLPAGQHMALSTVVAAEDCVVGLLSRKSLDAIEAADPRFVQMMRHNFALQLLKGVQKSVPLFKDMSDAHLTGLSSKIRVLAYGSNEEINIARDGLDDRFCVIAYGALKFGPVTNTSLASSVKSPTHSGAHSGEERSYRGTSGGVDGILQAGQFFGELSLLAGAAIGQVVSYKNCALEEERLASQLEAVSAMQSIRLIAIRPTVLLTIDDQAFQSVFASSPLHLTELRVRLTGRSVELVHVLYHPRGYQSFFDFLESELAAESLLFWNEVKLLEDQCKLFDQVLAEWRGPNLRDCGDDASDSDGPTSDGEDDLIPSNTKRYGRAVHSIYTSGASSSCGSLNSPSVSGNSEKFSSYRSALSPSAKQIRRESVQNSLDKMNLDRRRHSEASENYKRLKSSSGLLKSPYTSTDTSREHSNRSANQEEEDEREQDGPESEGSIGTVMEIKNVRFSDQDILCVEDAGEYQTPRKKSTLPLVIVTTTTTTTVIESPAGQRVNHADILRSVATQNTTATHIAQHNVHKMSNIHAMTNSLVINTTALSQPPTQGTTTPRKTRGISNPPASIMLSNNTSTAIASTTPSNGNSMRMYQMTSREYRDIIAKQQSDTRNQRAERITDIIQEILRAVNFINMQYIAHTADYQINIACFLQSELTNHVQDFNALCNRLVKRQSLTHDVSVNDAEFVIARAAVIFAKAKYEVYNIMKNGNFQRYKKTSGFDEFMRLVKPFSDFAHQTNKQAEHQRRKGV